MDFFIKNYFKKDKSGKSDAYFLKKKINLDQIFFNKFLKFAKKDKKNIRICCHKNKNSELHNMINIMFKKTMKKYLINIFIKMKFIILFMVKLRLLFLKKEKKKKK